MTATPPPDEFHVWSAWRSVPVESCQGCATFRKQRDEWHDIAARHATRVGELEAALRDGVRLAAYLLHPNLALRKESMARWHEDANTLLATTQEDTTDAT